MYRTVCVLLALTVAAAAPAAPDPTRAGRFAVGVATVEAVDTSRAGRTLPTELWYPARGAGRDAAARRGRWPLVLIAHGFCGSRLYYDYLAPHLASYGFVVAAPDFTGVTRADCDLGAVTVPIAELPRDLSFVAQTLHDRRGPLSAWARLVRGARTGLIGNSLGGLAAVEATGDDPAFTAIVGLAPAVNATFAAALADLRPRRAWMILGASGDDVVSFTGATQPFFDGLPPPAFLVRFAGGGHTGFSDENPETEPDPRQAQHDVTKRYVTPFLIRYLAGGARFGRTLRTGDDGVAAVTARPK